MRKADLYEAGSGVVGGVVVSGSPGDVAGDGRGDKVNVACGDRIYAGSAGPKCCCSGSAANAVPANALPSDLSEQIGVGCGWSSPPIACGHDTGKSG